MPSSTELPTQPPGVRPVRFDRPLAGAAAAATGAAWGDPALDAVLAEVVENARREGLAQGYAAGWAAGRRDADDVARVEAAERAGRLRMERDAVLAAARGLLEALAEAAARRPEEPKWADLADTLADGALTIARAALARELSYRRRRREPRGSGRHCTPSRATARLVLHLAPADAALLDRARCPTAPCSWPTPRSRRARSSSAARPSGCASTCRPPWPPPRRCSGHDRTLVDELRHRLAVAAAAAAPQVSGSVAGVVGLGVRVRGIRPGVGDLVTVHTAAGSLPAQVVAVHSDAEGDGATCMPLGATTGIATGDEVVPTRSGPRVPAGPGLLGRVVDALGRPLDGAGPLADVEHVPLDAAAPNPLHRRRVDRVLPTGVRALDAFTPARRRPARRHHGGLGRRQVDPARDGRARHRRAGPGRRPGGRARPRGPRVPRGHPRRRRPRPHRRRRGHRRRPAAAASDRGVHRDPDRGVVPRPRRRRAARRRLRHAHRARAARGRPRRRRAARDPRLPGERLRDAAPAARAGRPGRDRQHHRALHRARRGRRPAGPDRRHRPRHPRRPRRARPRPRHRRALPERRRPRLGLPGGPGGPPARAPAPWPRRPGGCSPRTATSASSSRSAPTRTAATPSPTAPSPCARELDAFLRQAPGDVADPEDTWARLAAIVPADLVAELTAEASAAGGAA